GLHGHRRELRSREAWRAALRPGAGRLREPVRTRGAGPLGARRQAPRADAYAPREADRGRPPAHRGGVPSTRRRGAVRMRAFVVDEPRIGALRALNYAPAVERIRRAGSSSARPLSDIVKAFGPAYGTVFTRLDCHSDHGIELLSQSDMFAAEPRGRVI